ncbi:uncharacterized protein B0I36DRAFT_48652 [Microdochium trichocladiopsis]|uniref:Uncharacterized protein n=1 Tax=Microdochium trichocladiopsis TaxID=1682393 RepID=A0A9P9BG19_9PEZI|nr:uncharacterized protein B0I36DRAFT_48652 [Microdochium trichocladiopsis]KAH7014204.1 hypothetical protein B0I36DRAFT_48652 [Microdochium trichocladiopsis]
MPLTKSACFARANRQAPVSTQASMICSAGDKVPPRAWNHAREARMSTRDRVPSMCPGHQKKTRDPHLARCAVRDTVRQSAGCCCQACASWLATFACIFVSCGMVSGVQFVRPVRISAGCKRAEVLFDFPVKTGQRHEPVRHKSKQATICIVPKDRIMDLIVREEAGR